MKTVHLTFYLTFLQCFRVELWEMNLSFWMYILSLYHTELSLLTCLSIVETGFCNYLCQCINKQICKYKCLSAHRTKWFFFASEYACWVLWIHFIFKCAFWSSSLLVRWTLIKLGSLCSRNMKTVFRSVLRGASFCQKLPKSWLQFGKLWRKNKWRTNHCFHGQDFLRQMGRFHYWFFFLFISKRQKRMK